jgi:hypothetical protein
MSRIPMVKCDVCKFEQEEVTATDWMVLSNLVVGLYGQPPLQQPLHVCSFKCLQGLAEYRRNAQEAMGEKVYG